ncbi:GFA family protein [Pelagibacterium montanilacus]|uniref:GFA family protein n=1 Tax=Pelagibacterium montanilacus TaxID=2185280 RepID=UPI0019D06152|nr:GFA family protein [Pelagibacterium montanilacus]
MSARLTGGCQCGAVRFRIKGPLIKVVACHCRMCQKATGGLFGAYAAVASEHLDWIGERPTRFRSSSAAERGFCPRCGTPLTFEWSPERCAIALGAFDTPEALSFDHALEVANAHPGLASLLSLPEKPLADTPEAARAYGALQNFQHPDKEPDDERRGDGHDDRQDKSQNKSQETGRTQ